MREEVGDLRAAIADSGLLVYVELISDWLSLLVLRLACGDLLASLLRATFAC